MRRVILPCIALLLCLFLPATPSYAAEAVVYKCDRTRTGNDGWISPVFFFEIDEANAKVVVLDVYTQEIVGGPVVADSYENRSDRHSFKWTLKQATANRGTMKLPGVIWSATLLKNSLKLRLHVRLLGGYDNQPYGEAKCAVGKMTKSGFQKLTVQPPAVRNDRTQTRSVNDQ